MGCIYIIKNKLNDKVYIGQTKYTAEHRFKQHIYSSKHNTFKNKLYDAICRLGDYNFYVETLHVVSDNSQLNKLESMYIDRFDSVKNGYNSIRCYTGEYIDKDIDIVLDDLIGDYVKGMQMIDLSVKYSITPRHAYDILRSMNIHRDNYIKEVVGNNKKAIVMFSANEFKPLKYFESKNKAYDWLSNNTTYKAYKGHVYMYLKQACLKGSIAYGYRWQLLEDIIYDNKIFRSKFDVDTYKNGNNAHKADEGDYWIVDNVLDFIIHNQIYETKCKICNKTVVYKDSLCEQCYNEKIRYELAKKSDLETLLNKGYTYEDIAKIYKISGKTVSNWCVKYGIKERITVDKSGVTCVNTGVFFEKFTDAALWLINNNYVKATDVYSVSYRISRAKKSGNQYAGFEWA